MTQVNIFYRNKQIEILFFIKFGECEAFNLLKIISS